MALNITRTVIQMVSEANEQVEEISVANALRLVKHENIQFIDVRDIREVAKTGRVLGARHVPRGMLEMWIDPETPYHREFFAEDRKFIFYCASAWRSALATQTVSQMGMDNVCHMAGGFTAWTEAEQAIEAVEKKV